MNRVLIAVIAVIAVLVVVLGALFWRRSTERLVFVGTYVQDPNDPRTQRDREEASQDPARRGMSASFESLETGRALGRKGLPPLQLLVIMANGEAGIRPAPPNPSLAATGDWISGDEEIEIRLTHHVGQELPEPVTLRVRIEGNRLRTVHAAPDGERDMIWEKVREDSDCTCAEGRAGETVWCLEHDRGWVDGHETPCWRCSYAAHRGEPCPECRSWCLDEGRRLLLRGEREQAAVLLAHAHALGADGPNLPYLLARSVDEERRDTWTLGPPEVTVNLPAPRGDLLAEQTASGALRIRDLVTGKEMRVVAEPFDLVFLDPAGTFVLTTLGAEAHVWQVRGEGTDAVLRAHRTSIVDASVSRSGGRIATIDETGHVRVWAPDGTAVAHHPPREDDLPDGLAVSLGPRGERVAAIRGNFDVEVVAVGGESVGVLRGTWATHVELAEQGPRLLVNSLGSGGSFWDAREEAVVAGFAYQQLDSARRETRTVGFVLPSSLIYETGEEGTGLYDPGDPTLIWKARDDGERDSLLPLAELRGHLFQDVMPSGHRFLTTADDGRVHVWAVEPVALLASYETTGKRARIARFSRTGEHVVIADSAGTVHVWSAARDTSSLEEMVADVEANSPWRIEGRTLVPRAN